MAKGTKHDFLEYGFAKAVTKDFPFLIGLYERVIIALYPYAKYKNVWLVLQTLRDNQTMLQIQLDYYKNVYEKKGKMNE